mmetsp:Transcript_5709/g.13958  ORF Transcript_5709/g.13958 Transcript_5709/m.13958 type:complete len:303 (-) Transcript_5709:128-1036(-)
MFGVMNWLLCSDECVPVDDMLLFMRCARPLWPLPSPPPPSFSSLRLGAVPTAPALPGAAPRFDDSVAATFDVALTGANRRPCAAVSSVTAANDATGDLATSARLASCRSAAARASLTTTCTTAVSWSPATAVATTVASAAVSDALRRSEVSDDAGDDSDDDDDDADCSPHITADCVYRRSSAARNARMVSMTRRRWSASAMPIVLSSLCSLSLSANCASCASVTSARTKCGMHAARSVRSKNTLICSQSARRRAIECARSISASSHGVRYAPWLSRTSSRMAKSAPALSSSTTRSSRRRRTA